MSKKTRTYKHVKKALADLSNRLGRENAAFAINRHETSLSKYLSGKAMIPDDIAEMLGFSRNETTYTEV